MNGRERILNLLSGGCADRPARGEIWPLPSGGPAGEVLAAARKIDADFCFFDQLPGAVSEARALGLATGAIVNGPWQRWMNLVGWEAAMMELGRGNESVRLGLAEAAKEAGRDISAWAAAGVDLILLADDVAFSGGPYMAPAQFEKHLLPFYAALTETAAKTGTNIGFHSDGCVDLLLPMLHTAGFGFYSLEPEATEPMRAWALIGKSVPLFSGLPAAWLLPGGFTAAGEGGILKEWLSGGPLILTSACGLFHAEALAAVQKIYQCLDKKK